MNQLQNLKRGRKSSSSLVSRELAQEWEDLRIKNEIPVYKLPVSPPTYRKIILTGLCDRMTFNKLSIFFQGGER